MMLSHIYLLISLCCLILILRLLSFYYICFFPRVLFPLSSSFQSILRFEPFGATSPRFCFCQVSWEFPCPSFHSRSRTGSPHATFKNPQRRFYPIPIFLFYGSSPFPLLAIRDHLL